METIAIVASDRKGGIGHSNTIPWRCSSDLKRFKEITTGHTVVMGRETYDSIGKPLPNRRNIVVSSSRITIPGVDVMTLDDALQVYCPKKYIIGGQSIYEQTRPHWDALDWTLFDIEVECDRFFPLIGTIPESRDTLITEIVVGGEKKQVVALNRFYRFSRS